ncbi:hypothetical protein D3C80_1511820 [compost metagenome]
MVTRQGFPQPQPHGQVAYRHIRFHRFINRQAAVGNKECFHIIRNPVGVQIDPGNQLIRRERLILAHLHQALQHIHGNTLPEAHLNAFIIVPDIVPVHIGRQHVSFAQPSEASLLQEIEDIAVMVDKRHRIQHRMIFLTVMQNDLVGEYHILQLRRGPLQDGLHILALGKWLGPRTAVAQDVALDQAGHHKQRQQE